MQIDHIMILSQISYGLLIKLQITHIIILSKSARSFRMNDRLV